LEEEMTLARKRAAQIALARQYSRRDGRGVAPCSQRRRAEPIWPAEDVLHVVVYKFRTTFELRRKNHQRIRTWPKIAGIKNVWLKRAQPNQDFSGVYAIEFTSAEALPTTPRAGA